MSFVLVQSYITSNIKKNQKCWNCDHFQRYDQSETPLYGCGQCRKSPLRKSIVGDISYEITWVPFIEKASIYWCSEWQKAVQEIPPFPASPAPIQWPDIWWLWDPWNVKAPLNISCWNCNHFQPRDMETTDEGECRKYGFLPVSYVEFNGGFDFIVGIEEIIPGSLSWCGCWERCQDDRPAPPATKAKTLEQRLQEKKRDLSKIKALLKKPTP